jgi:hypothetical protein
MTVSVKKKNPTIERSWGDVARVPAAVPERVVVSLAWAVPKRKSARLTASRGAPAGWSLPIAGICRKKWQRGKAYYRRYRYRHQENFVM